MIARTQVRADSAVQRIIFNVRKVPFFAVPGPQHVVHGDGSAYMNKRPKLGSEQGGLNVH